MPTDPNDNPYAAPQASLDLVEIPMAQMAVARNLFPDWDTKRLQRLYDYSVSLHVLSNWHQFVLVCLGAFECFLVYLARKNIIEAQYMLAFNTYLLILLIASTAVERSRKASNQWLLKLLLLLELFSMLLVFTVLAVIQGLGPVIVGAVVAVPFLGLWLLELLAAIIASFYAGELFGESKIEHRDLVQEYQHRQQYNIP